MKPTEALILLDNAASAANGTRLDHIRIQEAVKILSDFIAAQEKAVKVKAP
jgi:hypothetical protein